MRCSKCKESETENGQRWCAECRRKYQREYRRVVAVKAVRVARREGAERFKGEVMRKFLGIGVAELNGLTAAAIVEEMRA